MAALTGSQKRNLRTGLLFVSPWIIGPSASTGLSYPFFTLVPIA